MVKNIVEIRTSVVIVVVTVQYVIELRVRTD